MMEDIADWCKRVLGSRVEWDRRGALETWRAGGVSKLRGVYACDSMTRVDYDAALHGFLDCWVRCVECGRWTNLWVTAVPFGKVGRCMWCVEGLDDEVPQEEFEAIGGGGA